MKNNKSELDDDCNKKTTQATRNEEKAEEEEEETSLNNQTQEKEKPKASTTAGAKRSIVPGKRMDEGDETPEPRKIYRRRPNESLNEQSTNNINKIKKNQGKVEDEQVHDDGNDDESRPGAFRIEGPSIRGTTTNNNNNNNSDHITAETRALQSTNGNHNPSIPTLSSAIEAEHVDEDALEQKYQERARQTILQRIKEETTTHAVQVEPSNATSNPRLKRAVYRWSLLSLLLLLIICAIVIPIALQSSNEKQQGQTTPPTSNPNDNESTDFDFLKEQIILQYTGNRTKMAYQEHFRNASSAQYKALDWLVHRDEALLNVRDTELSILLDRYVMAVIYFSTNGPNWQTNGSYLSKLPVCEWGGITCDVTDSIVSIGLESNNLQGTIPMEYSSLSYLEIIGLRDNKLYGTIPSEIARLSRLELLQLSFNSLTGSIPEEFKDLTNLEQLFLGINQLTGIIPTGLIQLPLLERFHVGFNLLSGTIPEMNPQRQKDSLELLGFESNMLSGSIPNSVAMLANLEVLFLQQNQLNGSIPSEIGMVTKLLTLGLDGNQLFGTIPTTIGELLFLEVLSLNNNNQLNGTIPTEFGRLTNLQLAYLHYNELIGTLPSELGQLTNLERFFVHQNPITGTVPSTFSQLSLLEILDLSFTSLSGDLDLPICNQTNRIKLFTADCGSASPEVDCSCCTSCCNEEDVICARDIEQVCKNYARDLERNVLQNQASCSCTEDNANIRCDLLECPTCKEDLSVCGVTTEFQLAISLINLSPTRWISTMKFETGQHANHTLSWEYNVRSESCAVHVNGVQCNSCQFASCQDGFIARLIDCRNILNVDGPLRYNSCFPPDDEGSVLDIFGWIDTNAWTGCPFVPDEYIIDIA